MPRLFVIAYRILGSAGEAEDIVQDVWLRWQATDAAQLPDGRPHGALTKRCGVTEDLSLSFLVQEWYITIDLESRKWGDDEDGIAAIQRRCRA